MPADLEVSRPPDQQELPIDCVCRPRVERFGAGEVPSSPAGMIVRSRKLPSSCKGCSDNMSMPCASAAVTAAATNCGAARHRRRQNRASHIRPAMRRASMHAACPPSHRAAPRQRPARHSEISGAEPLGRSRRAVFTQVVVDDDDRPAPGKSGLRPQPIETQADIVYFVSSRHDYRDRRHNRKLARHC